MQRVLIVGGGAAGFFAAIACAEASPQTAVTLLEKGSNFLVKVRISGGGRCNVTNACSDPRELSMSYPRGGRALIGPFSRFQPRDTMAWFERRGVRLKTESDGRVFPTTDSSETIVGCLVHEAQRAGVLLRARCEVDAIESKRDGGFCVKLRGGEIIACDRLCLATGGSRTVAGAALATTLGHTLEPPVPSLFTFHVGTEWLRKVPGLVVEDVKADVPGTALRERGPLLITHWGMSGPVILRLSAWGARILHGMDYRFPLHINWLPAFAPGTVADAIRKARASHAARLVANTPLPPLPGRLWEQLVYAAGCAPATRWSQLPRSTTATLSKLLTECEFQVAGKSPNKEEFVTCGGVRLQEVDFRTMESRVCPGLHFAGELLDIDGITGGFNFQAAWTTGWIAGRAMAAPNVRRSAG